MAKLTTKNGIATKYSGDITELVIPEGITEIGGPEERRKPGIFEGHEELTSVILPDSLLRIGDKAFKGCSSLTEIKIPNGVTCIGTGAFSGCSGLTEIKIPNGVTCIGDDAFSGCSGITSLTIPDSVTEIKDVSGYDGKGAFENCTGLTDVIIIGTGLHIGTKAFSGCSNLKNVFLSEEVKSIGNYAFSGCSALTNINIPDSVTSIGEYAFRECSALTSIIIPSGVEKIGRGTFLNCINLSNIIISEGVTEIADCSWWDGAFEGCKALTNIHIPDSVTTIGNSAFKDCEELENITIPNNVANIGDSVFLNCRKLKSFVIPENLTTIKYKTFSGCSGLESVIIPDGLTEINGYVFENCVKLRNIEIPNSLSSIESTAFKGCRDLLFNGSPFLVIGTSLKAYAGNSSHVEIPEGVTEIQEGSIQKLTDISGVSIAVSTEGVFGYHEEIVSVKMPGSVKKIGIGAFAGCNNLKSITFSENTELIESYAFRDCNSLTELIIPDGVNVIAEGTFKNCKGLVKINLPGSITEIKDYAFAGCISLEEIVLPKGLTHIGYEAFGECSNLKNVVIPENVRKIGIGAFKDCTQITDISFPNGITDLDLSSFDGCSNLKRITIPSSVKYLYVKRNRWVEVRLDNLKQIVIDPNTDFETVNGPELLLKYDFEISPFSMIPISLIEEPDTKVKFFFEYCKEPEKYPEHIAEGYEKYGRLQRSRILREAEAQNRPEVIAYYEKKGHKAKERTLTPEERSALLIETIENGTDDDLRKVLKKHKTFPNASKMLETLVKQGNCEKVKILLEYGTVFPEDTSCFLSLLKAEDVSRDSKTDVCKLCISFENNNTPTDAIVFSSCILGFEDVINAWDAQRNPNQYLDLDQDYRYYRLFSDLSEEECMTALHRIIQLTDTNHKQEFLLNEASGEGIFHYEVVKFIFEHFSVTKECGQIIRKAVSYNQLETLKFLAEKWNDIYPEVAFNDYDIRGMVSNSISFKSTEMLKLIFDTGWGKQVFGNEKIKSIDSRNCGVIYEAIESGVPELLEILLNNILLSKIPASFSKPNALRTAIKADNPGALEILEKQGWIRTVSLRDQLIELATTESKTNALAWLLEYKNKTADSVKEEKARERKERRELEETDSKIETVKSIEWKTSKNPDGTYAIDRYLGTEKNLVIPAKIGKRTITTIREGAFNQDSYWNAKNRDFIGDVVTITISEGITTIENGAFYWCNSLRAVIIPESVNSIAEKAFSYLPNTILYVNENSYAENFAEKKAITYAFINNSEKMIPDYAINKEGTLIAYNGDENNPCIPDSVTAIGGRAFCNNSKITEIIIPESVQNIGAEAFNGCRMLKRVVIHNNVVSIGAGAFNWCSELTNIILPDRLGIIEDDLFCKCSNLQNISIPQSVTSIGNRAFSDCKKLTNITIPENVTSIGDQVFAGCSDLKKVIISGKVSKIGFWAFAYCNNLSEITIPKSVVDISTKSFTGCKTLLINGSHFLILNNRLEVYTGQDTVVVIPNGITEIKDNVFEDHDEITSINIPETVRRIGIGTFSGCTGLTNLTIPEGVTSIGFSAFSGCTGLTNITIPEGVTEIGSWTFEKCKSLSGVTLPQSLTKIDDDAFYDCVKSKLVLYVYKDSEALEFAKTNKLKFKVIDK